jgi:hypothetical protein
MSDPTSLLNFGVHYYNLHEVALAIDKTLEEIKEKKPDHDNKQAEKAIKEINEAMAYFREMHDHLQADRRRASETHYASIKLAAENIALKAEIDKLQKMLYAGI